MRRGDQLRVQQQLDEAVATYRTAVRADPSNGEARFKLASALLDKGEWMVAAPEAIKAADLLPGHGEAQTLAVSMLLGQQRFSEALERVSRQLTKNPGDPKLHVLRGNALARSANSWTAIEHFDKEWRAGRRPLDLSASLRSAASDRMAEEAFRRSLELGPQTTEATLALANLAWAQGQRLKGDAYLKQVADQNPRDRLVNRALGLSYLVGGRLDEAERYLRVAVSAGDPDARLALADVLVSQNRPIEALAVLDAMVADGDLGHVGAIRAAELELRLGQVRSAMNRADTILGLRPDHAAALRLKAQVLLTSGDPAQAVSVAHAAVGRDPSSREAHAVLGRALAAAGDPEQAFDALTTGWRLDTTDAALARDLAAVALTLNRDDVALDLANRAVRLDPHDRRGSLLLVGALIRTGDVAAAERALASIPSQDEATPEILAVQAAIHRARGNREGARKAYLGALQTRPESGEVLADLVALEIASGQAARVRPRVIQAVAAHPRNPEFHALAAQVSLAMNDATEAETALRNALALNTGHVSSALMLGDLLTRQARFTDALGVLEQTLQRRPASFDLQLGLARLLERMGRVPEARARYERLAASNPDHPRVSVELAALHVNHGGNLDIALTLAASAKQRLPGDAFVNDTLGWVYVRRGLPTMGIPHLEDAVRADPTRAVFRFHLGMAYYRGGQMVRARDELTRALTIDPKVPGAQEAAAVLRSIAESASKQ